MPRKYTPKPEHVLQASVAKFFKAWMDRGAVWSSADHGITFKGGNEWQGINEWNRLAARGVKKSLPDLPVIFYRRHLHQIELKRPGEDADDGQAEWGEAVIAQGGTWDCCHTRREVWDSMCRAFPDDNPLRPPPAMLQLWLAEDDVVRVVAPKPKRTGATKGKSLRRPTLGQVARGNRMAMVGVK